MHADFKQWRFVYSKNIIKKLNRRKRGFNFKHKYKQKNYQKKKSTKKIEDKALISILPREERNFKRQAEKRLQSLLENLSLSNRFVGEQESNRFSSIMK